MRTAGRFNRNGRETEWAVSHRCGYLLFALQPIHLANEHEYREGNKQEVEESVEEDTVIDGGCPRSLRLGEGGIGMSREVDELVREIRVAREQANRGHQNVGDKGAHNSHEGCANNDAHRHVEHATAHGKISEFPEHPATFLPQERFRAAQVSHSEIVENRVVSGRHDAPPYCSMLFGAAQHVKQLIPETFGVNSRCR